MDDIKSEILDKLENKANRSGGHCGLYISSFEGDLSLIKHALNKLYIEGKITIHDGIHGKLIKHKSQ